MKRNHFAAVTLVLVLACVTQVACSTAGTNSVKSFDTQAGQTLLVAQAVLEQAKIEVKGTQYVHQFNLVVDHYNQAYEAYVAFHAAVGIGTNADSANLKQQLIDLIAELAKLRQILGNNGGPVT